MRRKISDRKIVGWLAILLVGEILLLLAHMGVLPFYKTEIQPFEDPAGEIISAENDLRRRGAGSLVWENYSEKQPVYYHDSVLTLSQSNATLQLQDKTTVHMSENTLVTIEPIDKDHPGEIRLHFRKGGIHAQNPTNDAIVEAEDWSLDIKRGSEVDLRRNGDVYEAVVSSGEVRLSGRDGSTIVPANQILEISGNQVTPLTVREELRWDHPPPARIYSHSETVDVDLHWHGRADQLVHEWQEHPETIEKLEDGHANLHLALGFGRHTFFLRDAGGTSRPLEVQVWKAPLIHLVMPLPRDRVQTGKEISFLWMFVPGLSGYRFDVRRPSSSSPVTDASVGDNSTSFEFDGENDVEWGVYGRDKEGFEIPPAYTYPLFIRENPLAAPKLKAPSLRKPARVPKRGARWIFQINPFPEAMAEDAAAAEAVFEWESVDGADTYIIEISETPDFRHPLVTQSESTPSFAWRDFPRKTIYWRVAAGTRDGRMGVFSEVATVNFQNLSGDADSVDGVQLRKIEPTAPPTPKKIARRKPAPVPVAAAPAPPAVVVPPAVATPTAAPPEVFQQPPPKPAPSNILLGWRPSYVLATAGGDQSAEAHVKSGSAVGLMGEWRHAMEGDRVLRSEFDFTTFKVNPSMPQDPSQGSLSWQQINLASFYGRNSEVFAYGAVAQQNFGISRSGNETVSARPDFSMGPAIQAHWWFGTCEYLGDAAGLIGSADGIETRQQLRWNLDRWNLGGGFEASWLTHSSGQDVSTTLFILLGIKF